MLSRQLRCSVQQGGSARPAALRLRVVCSAHTVTLALPGGREVSSKADSSRSLYATATEHGVALPASCLQGSCTSCVAVLLSGSVDQHAQTCLPQELVREGFVALCCAMPRSDVKIRTHAGAEARKRKRALLEATY